MPTIRRARHTICLSAALLCAVTIDAQAQAPTVTNPPNTQEYGIDAGAIFAFGDQSSVRFTLPAGRARVGFYLNNDSRWSIEPAVGLSYTKVEEVPFILDYTVEVGALYHFRPPADVYNATRASVAYFRPFLGIQGVETGGEGDEDVSDNEVSAGAGLGIKIPWREALAWRMEANAGYGFDNEAFRLGLFLGLSFFARR